MSGGVPSDDVPVWENVFRKKRMRVLDLGIVTVVSVDNFDRNLIAN